MAKLRNSLVKHRRALPNQEDLKRRIKEIAFNPIHDKLAKKLLLKPLLKLYDQVLVERRWRAEKRRRQRCKNAHKKTRTWKAIVANRQRGRKRRKEREIAKRKAKKLAERDLIILTNRLLNDDEEVVNHKTGETVPVKDIVKSAEAKKSGLLKSYLEGETPHAPIDLLVEYAGRGLTYKAIGKLLGLSPQWIGQKLKPYKDEIEAARVFKKNRSDVSRILQRRALMSISQEEIDDMPVKDRVRIVKELYDIERTEDGKPNSTASIHFNFIQNFAKPTKNEEHESLADIVDGEIIDDDTEDDGIEDIEEDDDSALTPPQSLYAPSEIVDEETT